MFTVVDLTAGLRVIAALTCGSPVKYIKVPCIRRCGRVLALLKVEAIRLHCDQYRMGDAVVLQVIGHAGRM